MHLCRRHFQAGGWFLDRRCRWEPRCLESSRKAEGRTVHMFAADAYRTDGWAQNEDLKGG